MNTPLKITVLGCGSSAGVPEVGCGCPVCLSDNPKNKRLRVSVFVEAGDRKILIDTSPDLRQQALRHGITAIDAILYTHDHADHIHGIDDVRFTNILKNDAIPAYGDRHTLENITQRFGYVFKQKPQKIWYKPSLTPHLIPDSLEDFDVLGVRVTPILQHHAPDGGTLGFRIGNFAYSTDVNGFPEESFEKLQNLDVWIVDCLRYTPSYTHSRLELTLAWIERIKPKRAILTHMAHQMDYDTLKAELPPGVEPAYDGLHITL